ncbi:MAG TPA: winged helix-turn-helix domain-containing protein [Gemmatimonadaceae bacterium]|jgi:DNA-binding transcriptional ArsR family regulator
MENLSDTPDLAAIAGLIGDRARSKILLSLMEGRALTASELARTAGITKQTASSHLTKLLDAHLITVEQAGRHRYHRLADDDVGSAIEQLIGLAARLELKTVQTGPADLAMRRARVCYDHLAGEMGVLLFDSFEQRGLVRRSGKSLTLTSAGESFLVDQRFDVESLRQGKRALCLSCLDWSMRRYHLAGALGAALLTHCLENEWARRVKGSRTLVFSVVGERAFRKQLAS